MPPTDVLQLEARTRELFTRAVATLKSGHANAPLNALDVRRLDLARTRVSMRPSKHLTDSAQTLSVFLSCVLSKKYPHPSSDAISVLAGLDYIDTIFTEFVGTLDGIIRNGKTRMGTNGPEEAPRQRG